MATRIVYLHDYLHDRPVGLDDDLLWQEDSISIQIQSIARRVLQPLRSDSPNMHRSDSLTFAVHGPWGTGKSSALRMIREEAEHLALVDDMANRIHFCEFVAPGYQGLQFDVRMILAIQIMTTLAGSVDAAIRLFFPDAASIDRVGELIPQGSASDNTAKSYLVLQNIAATLSSLIDFNRVLSEYVTGRKDGSVHSVVVLVDDLDRCNKTFVSQVLDAIQQLSGVPNLFFVLAVDATRLRDAVREQYQQTDSPVDPEYALEKYVQHVITVPNFGPDRLQKFLTSLLMPPPGTDQLDGTISQPNAIIIENVHLLQYGLRELTPRSVKRCLNTIMPLLEATLIVDAAPEIRELTMKECMLSYTFPDFYRESFLLTKSPDPDLGRRIMGALEAASQEYVAVRDQRQLVFNLETIAKGLDINWSTYALPSGDKELSKLALYLGRPTYWVLQPRQRLNDFLYRFRPASGDGERGSDGSRRGPKDGGRGSPGSYRYSSSNEDSSGSGALRSLPDFGSSPGSGLGVEADPEDDFQRLYIASEAGEATGNREESLAAAARILDLVSRNRTRFGPRHAPQVGNLAINAERFRSNELARDLYELALDLDPEHSNNIQNYVDFIVDAPVPDLYDRADELIDRLKTGRHQSHKPARTFELETRLSQLRGETFQLDAADQDKVDIVVHNFLSDPSSEQNYVAVLKLLDVIKRYDLMNDVARARYSAVTSEYDRYIALRGYADLLAATPDENNELLALDFYRYLIGHYSADEAQKRLHELRSNYATLLYKYDYDDEAGRQWFDAYLASPGNTSIRRAYSLYLLRAGRPDLAKSVSEGSRITEQVLQPARKPLPARFSTLEDRWWEVQLPLGQS